MLRRTWAFFVLTYAISWLLWLPGLLRNNAFATLPEFVGLFGVFAVFGPAIAAFILVGRESGRAGMGRLLRRAIDTRFNKWWLLPTLLLLPAIGLLTIAILILLGRELPNWTAPTLVTALITPLFILFLGGGLEEFGWRGYALDRMQTGKNAVVAVLYTWLYNNTGGTLLVAILFHTIGNTSAALLPPYFGTEIGRWVNFALLLITTAVVVLVWGWRSLNQDRPVPQPSLPKPQ